MRRSTGYEGPPQKRRRRTPAPAPSQIIRDGHASIPTGGTGAVERQGTRPRPIRTTPRLEIPSVTTDALDALVGRTHRTARVDKLARFVKEIGLQSITAEHIETDEQGKPKTEEREVPLIKTSPKRVERDQARLKQELGRIAKQGAAEEDLKLLRERGEQAIAIRNYKIGKGGKVKTKTVKVPILKTSPEELKKATEALKYRVGMVHKSPEFREKLKPIREEYKRKTAPKGEPRGFLEKLIDPMGKSEASGYDISSDIARAAEPGFMGAIEYLSRPGRAIETGLAKALVNSRGPYSVELIKGETAEKIRNAPGPLDAFLHKPKKGSVTGGDITEGLFNTRSAGLVVDILTDPLMYVGVGGLLKRGAIESAALAARIEKVAPKSLATPKTRRLIREARESGNMDEVLKHLHEIAKEKGVSTRLLGRLGRDRGARRSLRGVEGSVGQRTRDALNQARVRRGKAPILASGRSAYVPDSPALAGVPEAARLGLRRGLEPGFRIRGLTPLGTELGSISVKLPKALADRPFLPVWRSEKRQLLTANRQTAAKAAVYQEFEAESKRLKAALTAARRAGDRDKVLELRNSLKELDTKVAAQASEEGAQALGRSFGGVFQTPRELTDRISRQRYVHGLERGASILQHNTARRFMGLFDKAARMLPRKTRSRSLFKIQMHRMERHGVGGTREIERIAPLDDVERAVMEQLDIIDRQLGEFGQEVGTLDKVIEDYTTRIYQDTGKPFGAPKRGALDDALHSYGTNRGAGGYFQRGRRQYEMASIASPHMLAKQIKEIAPQLTEKEALAYAEKQFRLGRIRMTAENLARQVERGQVLTHAELEPIEQQAYEWSRRLSSTDSKEVPLFRDVADTEGQLKLHPDAARTYGLNESPFDLPSARAAEGRAGGVSADLERLDEAIEAVGRDSELGQQYQVIRDRLEREGAEAGLEPGERLLGNPFDPGSRLPDVRDEGDLAVVLDPRSAAFYRLNAEGRATAFRARWTAIDETVGRDVRDANEGQAIVADTGERISAGSIKRVTDENGNHVGWADRHTGEQYDLDAIDFPEQTLIPASRDGSIFYDVHTGKEYVKPSSMDKNIGVLIEDYVGPERLWPTETLRDVRLELLRQGEDGYQALYKSGMESLYGRVSGMIRYGVTVPFPAYHVRNMIADTLKSLQAGSGVAFHPILNAKLMAMALGRGSAKLKIKVPHVGEMSSEDFLLMADIFGIRSSQHIEEFARLAETGKFVDVEASGASRLGHAAKSGFGLGPSGRIGQAMIEFGARREDIARFWTFTQRLRTNGGDGAEAAWYMIKHHFDYGDLTIRDRTIMRNLFLFYTWYRKNIPLQFLEIISRPGFFNAVGYAYADLARGETPLNQDWSQLHPFLPDMSGEVTQPGLVPDYMLGQLGAFTTNWNGHTAAFAFGAPWVDINLVTNFAANPIEGGLAGAAFMNPFITTAFQLISQKDILTGREFKKNETSGIAKMVDGLSGMLGLGPLPEDDKGDPLLPWALNVVLRNIPVAGRASTSFYGLSSTRDPGRLSQWSREFSWLHGINVYVAPKEGKRLDAAYLAKVAARAAERDELARRLSNEKDPRRDELLKEFDEETLEWAKEHGIKRKYLKAVQGIGPAYESEEEKKGTLGGSSSDPFGGSGEPFGGGKGGGLLSGGINYNLSDSPSVGEVGGERLARAMHTLRATEGKVKPKPELINPKAAATLPEEHEPDHEHEGPDEVPLKGEALNLNEVLAKKGGKGLAAAAMAKTFAGTGLNTEQKISALAKAAKKHGIPPEILASIGEIETTHGESDLPGVKSGTNSSGAAGPFQFLQGSWEGTWGDKASQKNIYDYSDAVEAAAMYLKNAGWKANDPQAQHDAIFSYNHAEWYVQDVLEGAEKYKDSRWGSASQGPLPGDGPLWKGPKAKFTFADQVTPELQQIQPHTEKMGKAIAGIAGVPVEVISAFRPGATTTSGQPSDHADGNAIDIGATSTSIGGSQQDQLKGDRIAMGALIAAGMKPNDAKEAVHFGEYQPVVVNYTGDNGIRVQVIWKTPAYGGHDDHVHVGLRPDDQPAGTFSSSGGSVSSGSYGLSSGGTDGFVPGPGVTEAPAAGTSLYKLNEKGIGTPYSDDVGTIVDESAMDDFGVEVPAGDYGLAEYEPEIDDTVRAPRYRLKVPA